ncbi:MAG TPA: translocation/assembly module TamB domain-containing protein, partial [Candidatus Acidoferrales bacterium]|nr:translocation/assembly module TamB domain-containing protein [Candidatus Acidoferrales bacterium]
SQSAPQLDGRVGTDLGTIRGVAFNGLRGRVRASSGALTLSGGSVQLGSSQFSLDGDLAQRSFRVKATSPHVDMTDFNDFFGGADVFGGTGDFSVNVASNGGELAWDGIFVLNDASVRDYPLGYINMDLDSRAGVLHAIVHQSGSVGATDLSGTARFRPTASGLPNFKTASYQVRAQLYQIDLAATLPLIHQENLGLTGRLDAEGQMVGTLRNPIGTAKFEMRGGHMRHTSIDLLRGDLASDAYGVTLRSSDLTLPYLTAAVEGRYTFDRERIAGKATLRAPDLSSLSTAMRVPGALGGSALANVVVSGTVRRPLVSASVDAGRSTVYGIGFDRANINATYGPGQIKIGNTLLNFAGNSGLLSITGELPLQLQPLALGPKNAPIGLTMRAEKVDLSVLNPIIKRYMTLTGNLNIGASISGNAGNPIGNGTAQIRYATVHSPFELVPLTNLTADIGFNRDTVSLRTHANAGKGIVDVQGSAHVVPAEGLRSNAGFQFSTRIGLHGAEVDFPGWLRGTLEGSLDMTRSGVTPYVEGAVTASNAVVPFSAIYALATGGSGGAATTPAQAPGVPHLRPGHTIVYGGTVWGTKPQMITTIGAPTPAPTGVSLPPVDMRVALTAGNNVRVRGGNAIDLTTTGGIVIAGNLRAPTLDGQFYAVRGQVGYFDTNFRLVSGVVTFDPTAGLLPTMDVTAVTNASGAEITLHITGRVDNLSTDLSSNPTMTRDEIVATLLHAPQLASLTNSNSGTAQSTLTQTAQNYFNAELSRSLLYPFESALAQQLNIESVSFIFNPQGNLAIEVRKRFTNSISAVYQTTVSVPAAQSYGVSYRLRDYLSLDLIQTQPSLSTTTNAPTSIYAYTTVNLRYQFH